MKRAAIALTAAASLATVISGINGAVSGEALPPRLLIVGGIDAGSRPS